MVNPKAWRGKRQMKRMGKIIVKKEKRIIDLRDAPQGHIRK